MLSLFNKQKLLNNVDITYNDFGASPREGGATGRIAVNLFLGSNRSFRSIPFFIPKATIVHLARVGGVALANDYKIVRESHCKRGHELNSPNIVHWPSGEEQCRTCYMIQQDKRRVNRAASKAATNGEVKA